ncbi:MAG: substrate binding domain-containing protein, partial [Hoeflea sp. D1-CHI-28]
PILPPNLSEVLFTQPIDRFLRQHPWARVRILVSERMLDFVEHSIDLSFRVARPAAPNLVIRKLLVHRHRLCAAPSYLAVEAAPQTPGDLQGHARIGFGFQARDTVCWQLAKGEESYEASFEPTLAINDYLAVKAAIQMGTGIGELPGLLCRDELASGRLIEVLPDWRLPEITLYAVYAGKVGLSKLARAFLDEVSSHLRPASTV